MEDGREELVRGLRFGQVDLRAMKEIVAAGEKLHVHDLIFSGRMFLGTNPISIVVPSILVEEMDLSRVPPQTDKLPYLTHPAFDK